MHYGIWSFDGCGTTSVLQMLSNMEGLIHASLLGLAVHCENTESIKVIAVNRSILIDYDLCVKLFTLTAVLFSSNNFPTLYLEFVCPKVVATDLPRNRKVSHLPVSMLNDEDEKSGPMSNRQQVDVTSRNVVVYWEPSIPGVGLRVGEDLPPERLISE